MKNSDSFGRSMYIITFTINRKNRNASTQFNLIIQYLTRIELLYVVHSSTGNVFHGVVREKGLVRGDQYIGKRIVGDYFVIKSLYNVAEKLPEFYRSDNAHRFDVDVKNDQPIQRTIGLSCARNVTNTRESNCKD